MPDNATRILPGANPFTVHSPENLAADEVVALFVNVLAELTNVENPGHALIHGPRGSGKSMIFRFLQPDCQMLHRQCDFKQLPFLGLYVGVKRSDLGLTEFRRTPEDTPDYFLLEHLMVMQVLRSLIIQLQRHHAGDAGVSVSVLNATYDKFLRRIKSSGYVAEHEDSALDQIDRMGTFLSKLFDITETLCFDATRFVRQMGGLRPAIYEGPLCGYADILLPFLKDLRNATLIPECPIYLLVDDADLLSRPQTQVLNSWIHMRTTGEMSIKATTQYRYKTFRTPSGASIEVTHDYQSFDTAHLYTIRSRYSSLIREVIQKRLAKVNLDTTPTDYFPEDQAQEEAIREIAKAKKSAWEEEGRGYRRSDDASRYSRPDYIRDDLKGPAMSGKGSSKSGSTYSYAGLNQLINVSDGVYRYFLDPASKMYERQKEKNQSNAVTMIEPGIQDEKIREAADSLQFAGFDILMQQMEDDIGGKEQVHGLRNLVMTLGSVFHLKLLSESSERRVFSIALSNTPTEELLNVLNYGVTSGYLTASSIGNKEGTGRTRLYVLTRRIAPAFLLDPNGFAGYLFVTNEFLRRAIYDPKEAINMFRARLGDHPDDSQLAMFEDNSDG